jgi:hypothetical protein
MTTRALPLSLSRLRCFPKPFQRFLCEQCSVETSHSLSGTGACDALSNFIGGSQPKHAHTQRHVSTEVVACPNLCGAFVKIPIRSMLSVNVTLSLRLRCLRMAQRIASARLSQTTDVFTDRRVSASCACESAKGAHALQSDRERHASGPSRVGGEAMTGTWGLPPLMPNGVTAGIWPRRVYGFPAKDHRRLSDG